MKVHEYQAKSVLARFGVPVPRGEVAFSPSEAGEAATRLGSGTCVIKAQIHAGGRGKAGGVKVAHSPEEAGRLAAQMIGSTLVTRQTGPEGRTVRRVLVEQGLEIERELYLAVLIDRSAVRPVVIASASGGIDIEEVAASTPEKILREHVDPAAGVIPFQARKLAFAMALAAGPARKLAEVLAAVYRAFLETDASMIEINPLVLTKGGEFQALDAKVTFDDSALYRHAELRELRDLAEEDPLEVEASKYSLNYIRLDGNIGCMVNGAGLAMATMDIIKLAGGQPANFLDVGGGANAEQVKSAFRLLMADRNVKAVLINIFGGILRCDVLAQGLVAAVKELGITVPIVIRMEGTNVEDGKRMIRESGLNFTTADSMGDAARTVVALANQPQGSAP